MKRTCLASVVVLSALLAPTFAQRGEGGDAGEGSKGKKDGIQPYDEVVTEEYASDPGLLLVHHGKGGKGKVLFEIPRAALDVDLLWVTQIARTQAGFGYGGTGVGNRVVRWELRDEKVLLRDVKYSIRAQEDNDVALSVEATSLAPIIASFPVAAWGKDQAAVIDATSLFTDDLPEFSPKRRLDASGIDKDRTFVESIKSFPENVETKVLATYKLSSGSPRETEETPRRRGGDSRRDPSQGAVTVLLHHSMVKLPEKPMAARVHDDRVGFFAVSFEEYGDDEQEVDQVRYVTRWRLEKKDPEAEVSEPVEPIVFHVGRGVPDKWRPWIHKGIEMWQPAFEAAGFRDAIVAKDAPSVHEDPDWDAEDARYSSIRWLPSTVENAMGPHVNDPRTGEILEADILVYHNVIKLVRDWYFVQASPNDPRAQALPLPDEVVGEALAYVIAHEVGHSLGFPHNMKASSSYTVEQLRDPEFTAKNGTEASIMDYGRFNYVAQPGDGARLIPTIGPYDFFAVEWGYRQYADDDAQEEGLRQLVARQIDDPMLRFGNPNPAQDPSQQTEDLGSDSIRATELGLANIDRVAGYLVDATCKEGENYDLLSNMYGSLVGQRDRELGHVANVVGGVVRNNAWFGDAPAQYDPVAAERQREAVAFLNEHAFRTPAALIDPDILLRLEAEGAPDRVLSGQERLLSSLLSESRVKRMAEHATRTEAAYEPVELVEDLRRGIWSELDATPIEVDLYRRNLQRAHVELLAERLASEDAASDLPALARGELNSLLAELVVAFDRAGGRTTRLHLEDVAARIRAALDPHGKKGPDSAATAAVGSGR